MVLSITALLTWFNINFQGHWMPTIVNELQLLNTQIDRKKQMMDIYRERECEGGGEKERERTVNSLSPWGEQPIIN